MNVQELAKACNLTITSGEEGLTNEVTGGYVSDLLSDVMGHAENGQVWITLQTHKNVIAVASLKDLAAVVLVKGNQLDEDALQQSRKDDLPVLQTQKPAFEIVGKIYEILNKGQG